MAARDRDGATGRDERTQGLGPPEHDDPPFGRGRDLRVGRGDRRRRDDRVDTGRDVVGHVPDARIDAEETETLQARASPSGPNR